MCRFKSVVKKNGVASWCSIVADSTTEPKLRASKPISYDVHLVQLTP